MVLTDFTRLAPSLQQTQPGWYEAGTARSVSFPTAAHAQCFELESSSFWFAHRNAVLLDTLGTWPPPGLLLDVGGGNGFVTLALQNAGYGVALLEPGGDGALNARARGVRQVVRAGWEDAGFLPETLGAVGLFDVLEHVAEDVAFLRSLHRSLVPGGRLYLTVPGHRWLWSREDVHAGHFRRYTREGLTQRVTRAGFLPERVTHFFGFLPLPIFLGRTLRSRLGKQSDLQARALREHRPESALVRALVTRLGGWERQFLAGGGSLAHGSSLLMVARKA